MVAAVLAVALLAGLAAWWLWPGDGERPSSDSGAGSDKPSASDTSSPSKGTSDQPSEQPSASEEPTQEPSAEPSTAAGGGQRAAMRTFVQDYFATVTSDPESTWAMLTPEFQAASGGYDRYAGFWSTIASATAYDIAVDPKALTTSYTIDYVTTSGAEKTEQGQLQLEKQGDQYLIAGEG
jgi:hypothetical protein